MLIRLLNLLGLLGAGTAGRQVLAHIVPDDPGYGTDFLGLHFYSWALIAFAGFVASILYAARLLFVEAGTSVAQRRIDGADAGARLAIWFFGLLVAANLASTFLECGFTACPDNPTSYEWLSRQS